MYLCGRIFLLNVMTVKARKSSKGMKKKYEFRKKFRKRTFKKSKQACPKGRKNFTLFTVLLTAPKGLIL
jgi:hypothetical protein